MVLTSEQEKAKKALMNISKGYKLTEITEEYIYNSELDELELQKKKITKKQMPPDLDAYKIVYGETLYNDLSEEELEKEKQRLLRQLLSLEKKEL